MKSMTEQELADFRADMMRSLSDVQDRRLSNDLRLTNDELQRRIEILKVAGVRHYKEGGLELDFAPGPTTAPSPRPLPSGAVVVNPGVRT